MFDFDSFLAADARLGAATHERDAAIRLERECRPKCGNCTKWMKSCECPYEKSDMSGISKGPTTNGIPCADFVENPRVAEMRKMAITHRQKSAELLMSDEAPNAR